MTYTEAMSENATQLCVFCGAQVPEKQELPYPGHAEGCALVAKWLAEAEPHFEAGCPFRVYVVAIRPCVVKCVAFSGEHRMDGGWWTEQEVAQRIANELNENLEELGQHKPWKVYPALITVQKTP